MPYRTALGRSGAARRGAHRRPCASWWRWAFASSRPGASSARRNFSMATDAGLSAARCYQRRAHAARVLPVVVPEAELVEVQREAVLADLVEGLDHTALHEGPAAHDVVGVDVAA